MTADLGSARLLASASPAALAYVTTQGRWLPFEHLLLVDDYILRVANREITRLIIELPVRHGKSELVSRFAPAWWLGRFPDDQVMLAGYEATFARSWGRKARDILAEHGRATFGVEVSESPAAADWWTIKGHEGVMVTAGVGGALTGKGADLLVIDDPVKNAEEAQSEVYREKTWDWWQSTARSRLQPGGRVVVVMARWHEDDFVGRLLAADDADSWTVVRMAALCDSEEDPLGRQQGDALCPEMFDVEALERARTELGGYWFGALYQQRPSPPEGFLFKRKDFRYWRTDETWVGATHVPYYVLPDDDGARRIDTGDCVKFQIADVAMSSKQTADYTVVSTWAASPVGDLVLLDVRRRQFEEQQTVQFLAAINDEHGRPVLWVERFGAGRSPLMVLARLGHPVREIPAEAGTQLDKVTRAFGAIAMFERHRVFLPMTHENLSVYEDELAGFPNGTHDDMVDVTSYAARLLPQMGVGRRPASEAVAGPRPMSAGLRSVQF